MKIPVGGRGKKAPYDSEVIRVPVNLRDYIDEIIEEYKIGVLEGKIDPSLEVEKKGDYSQEESLPDIAEAVEIAQKILRGKRSARETCRKLLQVLYSVDKLPKDL